MALIGLLNLLLLSLFLSGEGRSFAHMITSSVLLTGALRGGLVNSTHIASQLAAVILQSRFGCSDVSAGSNLTVEDANDRWLIVVNTTSGSFPKEYKNIEICKLDAKFVFLNAQTLKSDIIDSAGLAKIFASIIIENLRGEAELMRQLPFGVENQGQTWLLTGSSQPKQGLGGPGPCHFEIRKQDACIVEMWFDWVM